MANYFGAVCNVLTHYEWALGFDGRDPFQVRHGDDEFTFHTTWNGGSESGPQVSVTVSGSAIEIKVERWNGNPTMISHTDRWGSVIDPRWSDDPLVWRKMPDGRIVGCVPGSEAAADGESAERPLREGPAPLKARRVREWKLPDPMPEGVQPEQLEHRVIRGHDVWVVQESLYWYRFVFNGELMGWWLRNRADAWSDAEREVNFTLDQQPWRLKKKPLGCWY